MLIHVCMFVNVTFNMPCDCLCCVRIGLDSASALCLNHSEQASCFVPHTLWRSVLLRVRNLNYSVYKFDTVCYILSYCISLPYFYLK